MKVKICGITRPKDIKICEKLNPAFIGFINIKRSKRFVKLDEIKRLTSAMQKKEKAVLVIEPENVEEAKKKAIESGIKILQLHSLSTEEINEIKNEIKKIGKLNELKIIRVLGISDKIDKQKEREIKAFSNNCDYIMFDKEIKGMAGGTGLQIPLEIGIEAAKIAKKSNENIKILLAGGINAERLKNDGISIKKFFDYVDVNSGVEDKHGIKNAAKIDEVMKITRELK